MPNEIDAQLMALYNHLGLSFNPFVQQQNAAAAALLSRSIGQNIPTSLASRHWGGTTSAQNQMSATLANDPASLELLRQHTAFLQQSGSGATNNEFLLQQHLQQRQQQQQTLRTNQSQQQQKGADEKAAIAQRDAILAAQQQKLAAAVLAQQQQSQQAQLQHQQQLQAQFQQQNSQTQLQQQQLQSQQTQAQFQQHLESLSAEVAAAATAQQQHHHQQHEEPQQMLSQQEQQEQHASNLKYPVLWQGQLAMKNTDCLVQMHRVCGNEKLMDITNKELVSQNANGKQTIRITQRMRLEQNQLESLMRKMDTEENYVALVCLPCGHNRDDISTQSLRMSTYFIEYFTSKMAAGIVNQGPQTASPSCVAHVFSA